MLTMKKIFQILGMVAALGCTACEDKLDIVPLGETTLTTVDELETLLNQEPLLYQLENHFEILCNNTYTDYDGLPDFLANRVGGPGQPDHFEQLVRGSVQQYQLYERGHLQSARSVRR